MRLRKIISGGQTGADQGGLEAAHRLGIATGGFAPLGYRTENGPNLLLRDKYGLIESQSPSYPARTLANIIASSGTVIIGWDGGTKGGSWETKKLCKRVKKPCLVNPSRAEFLHWLDTHNIVILNVAGPRESKVPGVYNQAEDFLFNALTPLLEAKNAKVS